MSETTVYERGEHGCPLGLACRCSGSGRAYGCDYGGWIETASDGARPCPECRPEQARIFAYSRTRDELSRRLQSRGRSAEIAAERDARRLRQAARRLEEAEQRAHARVA